MGASVFGLDEDIVGMNLLPIEFIVEKPRIPIGREGGIVARKRRYLIGVVLHQDGSY